MDYFLCLLLSPAMHLSHHTDLANMNVYVYIYGFRYKNGWGWGEVYLSTLPSPDAFSICKYLQTAMSGIYVKVTMAELNVRLFQGIPRHRCVETNEKRAFWKESILLQNKIWINVYKYSFKAYFVTKSKANQILYGPAWSHKYEMKTQTMIFSKFKLFLLGWHAVLKH